jgi:PIN domain nuclease of toxin-antitoxin system
VIVLDTHALVWWVSGDERLSPAAADAIRSELANAGQIMVSAISFWEIAMLLERGRMALAMELDEWWSAVESIECVSVVPVSPRLAVQSVRLPGEFHKDPADRMIVALARELNAPLLTADGKIQGYPHIKWIW